MRAPAARRADIPRSNSDAIALNLLGNGAVAAGHGIIGVEHDLPRQRFAVISADLRHRAVRHGDEDNVAKAIA